MIYCGVRGRLPGKHRIIGESGANGPARRKGTHVKHSADLRRFAASVPSLLLAAMLLAACQPTVRVEAPKEPITINLNIKLDADVRVKLEEKANEDIEANPDIF